MWPSGASSTCWGHTPHTPLATRFSCNPTPTTSSSPSSWSWSYYRIIVTMASALGQSKPHTIQHAQGGAQRIVLLWFAQWNNTCPQLTGTRTTIAIRHHLSDTWVASQSRAEVIPNVPVRLCARFVGRCTTFEWTQNLSFCLHGDTPTPDERRRVFLILLQAAASAAGYPLTLHLISRNWLSNLLFLLSLIQVTMTTIWLWLVAALVVWPAPRRQWPMVHALPAWISWSQHQSAQNGALAAPVSMWVAYQRNWCIRPHCWARLCMRPPPMAGMSMTRSSLTGTNWCSRCRIISSPSTGWHALICVTSK